MPWFISQASDAMKLAASSGMTLKEAWAQIKGGGVVATTSSDPTAEPTEAVEGETGWHTSQAIKRRERAF